jgi:dTDP-glucose pyrophosphorylase
MEVGSFPSFMTEVAGVPLIQILFDKIVPLAPKWVGLACLGADIETYRIAELPRLLNNAAEYIKVNGPTHGAACTALLATEKIDSEDELLILGVNEYIEEDFLAIVGKFRARGLDAGVLTFQSIHPRYSFLRVDQDDQVIEAAEKRPISNTAAATFYWFKRGKQDATNGQYYIAPALNQMLLRQQRIGIEKTASEHYHPLKTTRQLENFEVSQEIRR